MNIIKLCSSDPRVTELGQVLGDAFLDDPLFQYLFPNEQRRRRANRFVFTSLVRMHAPNGNVYFAHNGQVRGGVIVVPRGLEPGLRDYLMHGLMRMPSVVGLVGTARSLLMEHLLEGFYDDGSTPHSVTVNTLAVAPSARGQGLGARLLRHALRSTNCGPVRSAALVTTRHTNVSFYRKQGFAEYGSDVFGPGEGVRAWRLRFGGRQT